MKKKFKKTIKTKNKLKIQINKKNQNKLIKIFNNLKKNNKKLKKIYNNKKKITK